MLMAERHLDLRTTKNDGCLRCQNRQERAAFLRDGLCDHVISTLDALPVRCVGSWCYDKIYRLLMYFGIFSKGMKDSWSGLNYVEICSGPGRCVNRENGEEIDGTALAIVNHPHFNLLNRALFIDNSVPVIDALKQRIEATGASPKACAVVGDYRNADGMMEILGALPAGCLNLVFIDPTQCDVPFATVQRIAQRLENADLIINVALGTDVSRNLVQAILEPAHGRNRAKYEAFLGTKAFFTDPSVVDVASKNRVNDLRRQFAQAYLGQLGQCGYIHCDTRPVRHYYYLLFASRNPKGLEFWNKACRIAPDDQRELGL